MRGGRKSKLESIVVHVTVGIDQCVPERVSRAKGLVALASLFQPRIAAVNRIATDGNRSKGKLTTCHRTTPTTYAIIIAMMPPASRPSEGRGERQRLASAAYRGDRGSARNFSP